MQVTFRLLVFALAAVGLAVGLSFGLGVAYGKGNPREVNTGLTQQQIQALIGGSGAAGGATGGAGAVGTARAGGQAPGGAATLNNTTGQITAVDATSVTVQTAQGPVKVNVAGNTTVQTLTTGKLSDLKVGDSIVVAGTRGADGAIAATTISALPSIFQGGGFGGGGTQQQRPGTP